MRRIVLDTNCLLMSLPKRSPCHAVWTAICNGSITLCVSNEILEEYMEILSQKTNEIIAYNVVELLLNLKNVVQITPHYKLHLISSDKDDNKFVDCAFAAGASCIVSNDAHFKELSFVKFPKISVLTIGDFMRFVDSIANESPQA